MLACLEACLQNRRDESFKKHFGFTYDLVRCIHIRDGVHLSHVFVSPSFATALGHHPESLLGEVDEGLSSLRIGGRDPPRAALFSPETLLKVQQLAAALKDGRLKAGFTDVYPLLHAGGHEVPYEHRCYLGSGENEVIVVSRDISERLARQRLEFELSDATARGAKASRDAYRVINHTSKRVLSNTVSMCNIITDALDKLDIPESSDGTNGNGNGSSERALAPSTPNYRIEGRSDVRRLLATTRAECTTGLNLCCSALLQARSANGHYTPVIETINLNVLMDGLGWADNPRFILESLPERTLCADPAALRAVLFNAGQNALLHGEIGGSVQVSASLKTNSFGGGPVPPPPTSPSDAIGATLRIEVRNAAGPKHAQLLELLEHYGHDDLIGACKSDGGHLLAERQLGLAGSTYCGVADIAQMVETLFQPSAIATLRVDPKGVTFELCCVVEVKDPFYDADKDPASSWLASSRLSPRQRRRKEKDEKPKASEGAEGGAAPAGVGLPEGMIFVCVDDDVIPRMLAEDLIECAHGLRSRSLVLGASHSEVAGAASTVVELQDEFGAERIIMLIDENLDFDEGSFRGSEICRALRKERGFEGVILVVSADADEKEAAMFYRESGADDAIGKSVALAKGKSISEVHLEAAARAHKRRFGAKLKPIGEEGVVEMI